MCDRRLLALTSLLLLAQCVWRRDGVGARVEVISDDPAGPRLVLDAAGREHTLERVVLSVGAISLSRCPGSIAGAFDPFATATARAHGDDPAIGPLELDLLGLDVPGDAQLEARELALLPGRYCDVRIAVDGLAIVADGGALSLDVRLRRERVLRIDEQLLDASGRRARVVIVTRTSELLASIDPAHLEPDVDAVRALGAALGAIRVEAAPE